MTKCYKEMLLRPSHWPRRPPGILNPVDSCLTLNWRGCRSCCSCCHFIPLYLPIRELPERGTIPASRLWAAHCCVGCSPPKGPQPQEQVAVAAEGTVEVEMMKKKVVIIIASIYGALSVCQALFETLSLSHFILIHLSVILLSPFCK